MLVIHLVGDGTFRTQPSFLRLSSGTGALAALGATWQHARRREKQRNVICHLKDQILASGPLPGVDGRALMHSSQWLPLGGFL